MIPFTVTSAYYGNAEQTLIVVKTVEMGTLLMTQAGMPHVWDYFHTLNVAVEEYGAASL